jgi:hypothetical protein
MKLQALNNAVRFRRGEGFIQSAGGMGRKIVHHDADLLCVRIVNIGQTAHADSEILRRSPICHLHMAPGSMRIKKHEQIGRAITMVFIIVALGLARFGWDWLTYLADQLRRAFLEAHHRTLLSGATAN